EKDGGPGCPEDVARIIVLPVVVFQRKEDAAACKRITVAIEKSTRASRVLEPIAVLVLQQLRLDSGYTALAFKDVDEWIQPGRLDFDVVIEECHIAARCMWDRLVVTAAKHPIFRVPNDLDLRIGLRDPIGRSIRRSVVRQYDLEVRIGRIHDGG